MTDLKAHEAKAFGEAAIKAVDADILSYAERDCNTCQHHVQGASLDDIPARCWDCTGYKTHADGGASRYVLPLWQPIEIIKKETPMSGGMEDAARMEAEEAAAEELSVMRDAVAPRRVVFISPGLLREQAATEAKAKLVEAVNAGAAKFMQRPPVDAPTLVGTFAPSYVNPLNTQVGGTHYKDFKIQPIEFAIANKLDFFQKDILKYICRRKGDKVKRVEDLKKASHYIELYVQAIEKGDIE